MKNNIIKNNILNFKNHWTIIGWTWILMLVLIRIFDLTAVNMLVIIFLATFIHAATLITIWAQHKDEPMPEYKIYFFNLLNIFIGGMEMIIVLPLLVMARKLFIKFTAENGLMLFLFALIVLAIVKISISAIKNHKLLPENKTAKSAVWIQSCAAISYYLFFQLYFLIFN